MSLPIFNQPYAIDFHPINFSDFKTATKTNRAEGFQLGQN